MDQTKLFISVIIPTMNRKALLAKALDSLARQTYPPDRFEILVIDNGCQMETKRLCHELSRRISNVFYLPNPSPGLHSCRNMGLRQSKGQIAAFVDDDIKAFRSWLDGINEGFADRTVGMVGGKALPDYEVPPPPWMKRLWRQQAGGRVLGSHSLVDMGDQPREISPSFVFGCNYSIRRNLAIELGGFNPDGFPRNLIRYRGNGEMALSIAIRQQGYKVWYNPKASVYHYVAAERLTKGYVEWRYLIQGISRSYADIRRSGGLRGRHSLLRLAKHLLKLGMSLNDTMNLRCMKSYQKGYAYHRAEVRRDPELLAWVLRTNYWEDIPGEHERREV
jgi:glycosyltransferase involved in cell wall biosynthesis